MNFKKILNIKKEKKYKRLLILTLRKKFKSYNTKIKKLTAKQRLIIFKKV